MKKAAQKRRPSAPTLWLHRFFGLLFALVPSSDFDSGTALQPHSSSQETFYVNGHQARLRSCHSPHTTVPSSLLPNYFSFRYFGLDLFSLVWFHRFVAWAWLEFLGSSNPPASALRDRKYKDTILCQSYFLSSFFPFFQSWTLKELVIFLAGILFFLLFFVCYFIIQGYIRLFSCKYIMYVENSHPNTLSTLPHHPS